MTNYKQFPYLFAVFHIYILNGVHSSDQAKIHSEQGKVYSREGRYEKALLEYNAALALEPKNHLLYINRATIHLAMNSIKAAKCDLIKVIDLKPENVFSRIQLANILIKFGEIDAAYIQLEHVLRLQPENKDALEKLQLLSELRDNMNRIFNMNFEKNLYDHEKLQQTLSYLIVYCPFFTKLRKLRAKIYEKTNRIIEAINDYRYVSKLEKDNTENSLIISDLLYSIGSFDQSFDEVRNCLKLDPEHKECFKFFKNLKKVLKLVEKAENAFKSQDDKSCFSALESFHVLTKPRLMHWYLEKKCSYHAELLVDIDSCIKSCAAVIDEFGNDPETLCNRAECFLADSQYDEALRDFNEALEKDENFARAKKGKKKAASQKKQANKMDYYKILGVNRSAKKSDISKAYKKLAMKYHPDRHRDQLEKAKAEREFVKIARAKEVLTDDKMRKMYDNGKDPLDPHQNSGNDWGDEVFTSFFQGGGFTFHF